MSTLKVDTIQTTAGAAQEFGKVLQVVQTWNTDYISQSFSTNTNTNMTNMNVTITPQSTSSKILLQAQWFGELSNQAYIYNSMFGFRRGTTIIGNPTSTGSNQAGQVGIQQGLTSFHSTDGASTGESLWMQYLDSPSSTSSITYHTWYAPQTPITLKSGGTYSWNSTYTSSYERGSYGMTAWEIG